VIADFFGVPVDGLSPMHSYQSWRKHDVVARIDPAHVSSVIEAGETLGS
jgi:hypothetical protein